MAQKVVGYIELHWRCPNCGTQNRGADKSCASCGNPQPADVEFYQLENAELLTDENKIKAARVGPDVHCPYCGTRNTADAKVCFRCGGDLEDAQQRVAGKVLGAFGSTQGSDQTELMCPACSQPNASELKYCIHCGSPMKVMAAPAPLQPRPAKPAPAAALKPAGGKKLSLWLVVVFVLVALGCIGALIMAIIFGGKNNDPVIATVSDVYWKVSIDIEEQQYVTSEDWRNNLPGGATNLSCWEKLYSTSDVPSPGAEEVCGAPYTVDLGNGNAEVRQDCEYNVYEDYCSYEVLAWVVVDTVTYDGNDNDPYWTNPNLSAGQVQGDITEVYLVEFSGNDRTYDYHPTELYEFQQYLPGTAWELKLNLFGGIQSIAPVK